MIPLCHLFPDPGDPCDGPGRLIPQIQTKNLTTPLVLFPRSWYIHTPHTRLKTWRFFTKNLTIILLSFVHDGMKFWISLWIAFAFAVDWDMADGWHKKKQIIHIEFEEMLQSEECFVTWEGYLWKFCSIL